ncbi:MAG: hypothetical protein EBS01_12655, partial [Verrucomicrobia bacterium]|nr:hypothetical protein [Verrucomicrobiota bacterium]
MKSLLETAILWLGRRLVGCVYRLRVLHRTPLPEGGCLLLPNHVTWVDAILLQAVFPRPIRFLVFEEYYRSRLLAPILDLFGALPVSPSRAKESVRAAAEALQRGETVCLFPEGEISRSGNLLRLQRGFELIARKAGKPVVPVWLGGLWGSIFSYSEGRYFFKWPRQIPYPATIAFGAPIESNEATVSRVREALLSLGELCFQSQAFLGGHLGRAAISGLAKKTGAPAVVDGLDGVTMSRGTALRGSIVFWRTISAVLPASWIAALAGLPSEGGEAECVVLFTSGSAAAPKGVVLTHRNLLGNIHQFSAVLGLKPHDAVLCCLPIFHSFGSTVNLWYPMLGGLRMITYPSPLDPLKNAELIQAHKVRLLCSTPTFLRGYLRKVDPSQLRSLTLIVTGAEKLPTELALAFQRRFGKEVLQGYGLTETSPVASVNIPEFPYKPTAPPQPSNRLGSVGKLMPGMAGEIRDPESGRKLKSTDTGMLWLKGANIFAGYLD